MHSPTLHIFKPGTHTAMDGRSISFGEADLAATARAYNPKLHEAPLVVGHPSHDLPAYGWVAGLRVQDGELQAVPAQVDPAFAEMVKAGRFKKISAKFYEPGQASNPVPGVYYLRHVGFLGAQPPAIKGLRSAAFADADAEGGITLELAVAFSESDPPPVQPSKESTVTDQEAAQLRAENLTLKTRAEAAEKTATAQAVAALHASNLAFCEDLAAKHILIPAELPAVAAALNHMAAATGAEFGEGDKKQPLVVAFKGFLQGLPPRLKVGEQAGRDRAAPGEGGGEEDAEVSAQFGENADPERLKQHKQALAYASKHGVSYFEAASAVIK